MSLTVEDGTGIAGAESYAAVAFIDAYWTARSHHALATVWAASTTAKKEGAAREASGFIDNTWGVAFKGERRGRVQGLLWPRSHALDEAGYPLPGLPAELPNACAELAARALQGTLTPDVKAGGGILKRVKAGSVEVEWDTIKTIEKTYPALARMLAPLLSSASSGYFFGVA